MDANYVQHYSNGWFATLLLLSISFAYVIAAVLSNRTYKAKAWPLHRFVFWSIGVFCAAAAVKAPIASRAHSDFVAHMTAHILLGMLVPLCIAVSAPATLLLRTCSVKTSRRIVRLLKSRPIRAVSNPYIAAAMHVGSLWALYATDLYAVMQQFAILHLLIHLHFFVAGYVFTVSILYIDPVPHRHSFRYRASALIAASAAHSILSKYIFAHPPFGVAAAQAELGGLLMYYGGDAVEIVMVYLLCREYFKKPRLAAISSRRNRARTSF